MSRFAIDPIPTDEEAAAIVAALEFLTPVAVAVDEPTLPDTAWRFSGRSWNSQTGWPTRDR